MSKKTKFKRIPPPPNDGRTYKWDNGKHVPVGNAQQPMKPAHVRKAEAAKHAEAEQPSKADDAGKKGA